MTLEKAVYILNYLPNDDEEKYRKAKIISERMLSKNIDIEAHDFTITKESQKAYKEIKKDLLF